MNSQAVQEIRHAMETAKQAAHTAKLNNCDAGDVDEVIEAVSQQLDSPHPNPNTLTLYLNSLARSLISTPGARAACEEIDGALRAAGLPATWEQ
jgi:hypothetical protein